MTKKKVVKSVKDAARAITRAVEEWIRDYRTELGFKVSDHGSKNIQITFGNKTPSTCTCIKHSAPELTSVQKTEIRNFFANLAEKLNLKLVALQVRELGKQMVCLFEFKPAVLA